MPVSQAGLALPTAILPQTDLANARLQAQREKSPENVAKQFEAMFLSILLKDLRHTLEPAGLFPGDSGDVMGGMFDQYMSQHLADSGGVGLAAALERKLKESALNAIRPPAPGGAPPGPPRS